MLQARRYPSLTGVYLVHDNDMTPTLEAFHRGDIHIEVWGRERRGDFYFPRSRAGA